MSIVRRIKMTERPVSVLFRPKIRDNDVLLIRVRALGSQQYTGVVEKVYSRRFEGPMRYGEGPLMFVGAPGTWGNVPLKDGERALVFLRYLRHSDACYQDPWQGHLSVSEDGATAIANWPLLQVQEPWEPAYLRSAARLLDPSIQGKVAFPYQLIDRHLREEIALL